MPAALAYAGDEVDRQDADHGVAGGDDLRVEVGEKAVDPQAMAAGPVDGAGVAGEKVVIATASGVARRRRMG